VLSRDGHRCQVTGCPSRLELHIHHKNPVAKGGAHAPENLISLCDFHHALEPDSGHERIWAEIKTRYFTLVPHHTRSNRANAGIHEVKTHLRRLKLVSESDLKSIFNIYGLSCPHCRSDKLNIFVHEQENIVQAACAECEKSLEGPQELAEETGPRLAERLRVTRCQGQWIPRWDMLSERKKMAWGDWKGAKASKQRKDYEQRKQIENTKPTCPKCGGPMRLIHPIAGQSWSPFWGCTQFRVTGCKGSAKYRAST
jgi:transcription elongation factor Elf1